MRYIVLMMLVTSPAWAGPVHDAAASGDLAAAKRFLATGTAVDERDPQHATALHWAVFGQHYPLVELLLESGADVNAKVLDGHTPLHQAAYRGDVRMVELLIARGAEVSARTSTGLTPLDWAERNAHREVASLLAEHERDVPVATTVRTTAPYPPQDAGRVPAGRYRVQLAVVIGAARAAQAVGELQRAHTAVLAPRELRLVAIQSPSRPELYRLQTDLLAEPEAHDLCATLEQRDQECLVVLSSSLL